MVDKVNRMNTPGYCPPPKNVATIEEISESVHDSYQYMTGRFNGHEIYKKSNNSFDSKTERGKEADRYKKSYERYNFRKKWRKTKMAKNDLKLKMVKMFLFTLRHKNLNTSPLPKSITLFVASLSLSLSLLASHFFQVEKIHSKTEIFIISLWIDRHLLTSVADMNFRNKIDLCPLHVAITRDNLDMVTFLLSKGANPNVVIRDRRS